MMLTEFLSLLCLGLCLGYEDEKNERLPKPFFSALPSSVVESKSNVTLKCWSTFQNATFRLGKLNNTGSEEQLKSAENNVELLLTDLEPKDAGKYFCTYKTTASQGWAESEHLQLVVTDEYEGYEAPPIKMGGDENLGTLSSKQDSADGESTRRSSHSNFPNQEATDLSKPERTSLSAEDSEGNTRALCEAAYASY
ncbi:V-set and transmembrane domain-containing protein 1-like isoform X7 [Elephas maximus indicus]|uniref:V-set and transmembrane domain-containing protein 1-like isoform X7 n=1 Tax=Elephas maximus indicus TaxID=99487 RepID=UPI0021162CD9|nr:V-set and transmembrane domain-containing protein 1-like isoform X7 [Elephas maximus indicus]